ncbi:ubiquitin-associated protein 2 [Bombina bombina]|uniref:ubiquitin-associated protein 2 n=1 Tax=Bombina bombina TaxID=8345 RepID=UPI00235AEB3B|nr:ubiquitin-associated protein 2 [Bombina bombina]
MGCLSETKVFTASSVPTENHITPGQSIDLVALLQNPASSTEADSVTFESSQQQNFGQALVFTNSQHSSQITSAAGSSNSVSTYAPQSLVPFNHTKGESIQVAYCLAFSVSAFTDFKSQPEPSPVLSQLAQRQQHQIQPLSPPGLESFSSQVKLRETSPVDSSSTVGKMLQLPTLALDTQTLSAQQAQQQKQIKPQKRRIPPTSKIPASAVEMPGSADVTGLNVQFGALEFGLEPSIPDFGTNGSPDSTSQTPNNLYSKTISDTLNTSLPISSALQEPSYTPSVITTSSLSSSSQSTSPVTTTSSSYEQTPVHSRIAYQSSMPPADLVPVTNGHNGIRAQQALNSKYRMH